jgi:DNA-binding MarR family transcriptional regulator
VEESHPSFAADSPTPLNGGGQQSLEPFQAVGFMLSSLGYAIAQRFSTITAEFDLEPREFAILRRVNGAEGLSQQALSERLGVPPSRMVAAIDALESRKLLERRSREQDRRVRALHLTDSGHALLARAMSAASEYERTLTAHLSPAERRQLLALLGGVADALELPAGVHSAEILADARPGPRPAA